MALDEVQAMVVDKDLAQAAAAVAVTGPAKEQALATVLALGLEPAAAEAMLAVAQLRFRRPYHQGLYHIRNPVTQVVQEVLA
ncbi:hypothetical protein SDC9_91939 [bioreactor metagenome]|uniref:Uncharacterized protein n=1 Tax=bioreactor metagenome TaxID=1076179 RepID=A0A645A319_9ZZZZ